MMLDYIFAGVAAPPQNKMIPAPPLSCYHVESVALAGGPLFR